MFDIGFFEILVIAVVALLVVGPERLPKLARDVGRFVGKTRRFVQSVRADVERELATDELKDMMREQNREIERLKRLMHDTEDAVKRDVQAADRSIRREVDDQRRMLETLSDDVGVGDFGQDDPRIPGIRREPVKFSDDGSLTPTRDHTPAKSTADPKPSDGERSGPDAAEAGKAGANASATSSALESRTPEDAVNTPATRSSGSVESPDSQKNPDSPTRHGADKRRDTGRESD